MEITAWAQEHFRKSLIDQYLKTVHRNIQKSSLKLYHAKKKLYVNMIQKVCHLLWVKVNLQWTEEKWKTVLWTD